MLPEINLLPEKERQGSIMYYLFIGLIVLSILLTGYVIYAYFDTKKELTRTADRQTILQEEQTTLEDERNALITETVDTLDKVVGRVESHAYPTSIIINHLLLSLPAHSYLAEYNYKYGVIEVETHFETMNDISKYTETLLASPFVTNVEIEEIEAFGVGDKELVSGSQFDEVYNYYEVIPRYEVNLSLQMNSSRIFKVNEEEKETLLDRVEESIEEGVSAQ